MVGYQPPVLLVQSKVCVLARRHLAFALIHFRFSRPSPVERRHKTSAGTNTTLRGCATGSHVLSRTRDTRRYERRRVSAVRLGFCGAEIRRAYLGFVWLAGILYLYVKTIERAHTPAKMWEKIKLSNSYAKALEQVCIPILSFNLRPCPTNALMPFANIR